MYHEWLRSAIKVQAMCEMHLTHEDPYKVAIIDADLIGRKKHRFPNLVCMKLSGYWKEKDAHVELKTN